MEHKGTLQTSSTGDHSSRINGFWKITTVLWEWRRTVFVKRWQQIQETHKKRQDVFKEFHKLLTEFCELPEEEQERIRKELGFTGPFSTEKAQKDNTTTAFEHNKNKGKKNGK